MPETQARPDACNVPLPPSPTVSTETVLDYSQDVPHKTPLSSTIEEIGTIPTSSEFYVQTATQSTAVAESREDMTFYAPPVEPRTETRLPEHQLHTSPAHFSFDFARPLSPGNSNSARARADEHMRAQEELQDAREELLGMRFALRDRRIALTDLRQSAGVAEGALLSRLRKVFRAHGLDMPEDLGNVYRDLVAMRNHLGAVEVEYDEAEQMYNRHEWKYTQKEAGFIERLSSDGPSLNDMQRTEERLLETAALTRYASGPEEALNLTRIDENVVEQEMSSILELAKSASAPNLRRPRDATKTVNVATPHDTDVVIIGPTATSLRQLSTPADPKRRTRAPSIPYSETAISHGRLTWPETVQRIDSWIFDTIVCSPFQRARLRYFLSQEGLDDPSWWQQVIKHWRSDDSRTPCPDEELNSASHETVTAPQSSNQVSAFHAKPRGDPARIPTTQHIESSDKYIASPVVDHPPEQSQIWSLPVLLPPDVPFVETAQHGTAISVLPTGHHTFMPHRSGHQPDGLNLVETGLCNDVGTCEEATAAAPSSLDTSNTAEMSGQQDLDAISLKKLEPEAAPNRPSREHILIVAKLERTKSDPGYKVRDEISPVYDDHTGTQPLSQAIPWGINDTLLEPPDLIGRPLSPPNIRSPSPDTSRSWNSYQANFPRHHFRTRSARKTS